MKKFKRVFVVVLDSLGIGAMPDAADYGDVGVDTLGHISDSVEQLNIPNLQRLGLANLHPLRQIKAATAPLGVFAVRICAQPCEKQCKWNESYSPMAIASFKRYAADHFDRPEDWDLSAAEDNGKRVAVIGVGSSGLQTVLDLRQAGCEVTVYEENAGVGRDAASGYPGLPPAAQCTRA